MRTLYSKKGESLQSRAGGGIWWEGLPNPIPIHKTFEISTDLDDLEY